MQQRVFGYARALFFSKFAEVACTLLSSTAATCSRAHATDCSAAILDAHSHHVAVITRKNLLQDMLQHKYSVLIRNQKEKYTRIHCTWKHVMQYHAHTKPYHAIQLSAANPKRCTSGA
jgi:hypothetical protein